MIAIGDLSAEELYEAYARYLRSGRLDPVDRGHSDGPPSSSGGTHVTPPSQRAERGVGPWSDRGMSLVSAGVDSLYLAVDARLRPWVLEILEKRKGEAQRADDTETATVTVELGARRFRILPHGKKRFAYLLVNDDVAIAIGRRNPGKPLTTPSMYLKVSAKFLWSKEGGGALAIVRGLREWIATLHDGETAARMIPSRIDVCADMTGVDFGIDELNNFVTRGVHNGGYFDHEWEKLMKPPSEVFSWVEDEIPVEVWRSGRRFSGFKFGREKLAVRIYDKTRELVVSGKHWFRSIWAPDRGPFEHGPSVHWNYEPVWRVEVQVRREGLKEMKLLDESTGELIVDPDPETLLAHLTALWRYALGAPGAEAQGWIQWKIPSESNPQRARWKVRPEWEAYREVDFGETTFCVQRSVQKKYEREPMIAQGAGLIVTVAACDGEEDFERAARRFVDDVRSRNTRVGRLFARSVADRMLEIAEFKRELVIEEEVGWGVDQGDDEDVTFDPSTFAEGS